MALVNLLNRRRYLMRRHHSKTDAMNTQTLLRSRAATVVLAAILYAAGKSLAQFLGLDDPAAGFLAQSPGIGDTGLLLVWAVGHCDGVDGPVVMLAKKALETGNVNLVLPWVRGRKARRRSRTLSTTPCRFANSVHRHGNLPTAISSRRWCAYIAPARARHSRG
jgi:hypothetical protein